jgi:hypothetical protein
MGKRDREGRGDTKTSITREEVVDSDEDGVTKKKPRTIKGASAAAIINEVEGLDSEGSDDDEEEEDTGIVVKSVTLNALDEKIAALEAALDDESSSSEESSDEGDEGDDGDLAIIKKSKSTKAASIGGGAKIVCDICDVFVIGEDKLREVRLI